MPGAEPTSEAGELALTFNEMLDAARGRAARGDRSRARRAGGRATADRPGAPRSGRTGADGGAARRCRGSARGCPRTLREDARRRSRTRSAPASRTSGGSRSSCGPRRSTISGLASALAVLVRALLRAARRWTSSEHVAPDLPPLAAEAELVVYRVAQEALTNVARHSAAQRAELDAQPTETRLLLTVRDDGDGPAGRQLAGHRDARHARAGGADRRDARDPHAARRRPGCEVRLDVPLEDVRDDSAEDADPARRRPRRRPPRAAAGARRRSPTSRSSPRPATAPRPCARRSREDIDLAILDISMPRMTGLQAARELHRRRPELRDPDPLDARERAATCTRRSRPARPATC